MSAPVITQPIPKQAFELVRSQVAAILAVEFQHQIDLNTASQTPDALIPDAVAFFEERFVAIDQESEPTINITFEQGTLAEQDATQTNGTYIYNIDCYTSANYTNSTRGDTNAMLQCNRMMGLCRAILEDTRYKTLGFAQPFVMYRHVTHMGMYQPTQKDSTSSVMGRLRLEVKVPETAQDIPPMYLIDALTNVTIDTSNSGYQYTSIYNQTLQNPI
jgi:hypothetical protein